MTKKDFSQGNQCSDAFVLIIFGVTSNLVRSKLIPALYELDRHGYLPENSCIIGVARSKQTRTSYLNLWQRAIKNSTEDKVYPEKLEKLADKLRYLQGDLTEASSYRRLKDELAKLTKQGIECCNRIYYLATFPELYETIFQNLSGENLVGQTDGWTRVMIEKPIGKDMVSARQTNQLLGEYFEEDQIYRLDHYLGKETLLNILYFRFANRVFEPMMNSDYVDHIQITAAEDYGIKERGRYYDKMGALRDVAQNHLLQMLAFATMDCPTDASAREITRERIRLLKALRPVADRVVFGQYSGYRKEEYVDPDSTTDTFFAFKLVLNNSRFGSLPVYLRGGKQLKRKVTEMTIVFKKPKNPIFKGLDKNLGPPALIYRIYPNEGIVFKILTKTPGPAADLEETYMQFCYSQLDSKILNPYTKLLIDVFNGDQTYFVDASEVNQQWRVIDPLFERRGRPRSYPVGSWGPKQADQIIEADGRGWLTPSLAFCRY